MDNLISFKTLFPAACCGVIDKINLALSRGLPREASYGRKMAQKAQKS